MAGQDYAQENTNTLTTGQLAQSPEPVITQPQDDYITFVAAHGLSVEEDGTYTRISASDMAVKLGVHRNTFYTWQRTIPNFWERVDARSKEIFNHNRKHAIMRGLTMRALKGDSKQAEMLLSHFSDYVPPTQKHDIKITGMSELADLARKKKGQLDAAD